MGKLRDLFRERQTDHDHGHGHDHAHPKGTDPGREREREAPAQTFYKHAAGASRSTLSLNLVRDLMLRTRRGEQVDKGEDEQDGGGVERLSMASWVMGESEHDLIGPPTRRVIKERWTIAMPSVKMNKTESPSNPHLPSRRSTPSRGVA